MSYHQVEKRKEAVVLNYDEKQMNAPTVVAKGKGLIADKILAKAKENQVPIQEDPSLVELLGELNINDRIPDELYQAVAEVFAFIYRADKQVSKKRDD